MAAAAPDQNQRCFALGCDLRHRRSPQLRVISLQFGNVRDQHLVRYLRGLVGHGSYVAAKHQKRHRTLLP
jgi:hypothetical protein